MASSHAVGSEGYLADVAACVTRLEAALLGAGAPPLDAAARAFLTRPTLNRYATARNGDFEAALANLRATLAWRVEHVPAELSCRSRTASSRSASSPRSGASWSTRARPRRA